MAEPYVAACDLVKRYGRHPAAVDHVSFALARGEMLALLGPSGCGKTTILRMIAGLVTPSSGSIRVAGEDVSRLPVHRRNMGMVFQSYALLPHLTVAENVGFGLAMRGVSGAERQRRVQAALDLVKLGDHGERRIAQLSGGQQQRAALARSLVIEPSLLLLDEPLSNLDATLRDELRGEIRELQRRTATTAIFVTHDQSEALAAADRIAVMSAGRIEQIGAPADIFERPATRFVAGFIGGGTFFDAVAHEGITVIPGIGPIRMHAAPPDGAVTLLLRPHRIDFIAPGMMRPNVVDGVVESVTYTGELVTARVRVGLQSVTVNSFARGRPPVPGETARLGWGEDDVVVIPGPAA
jgi:putative spermidine/putrescine transport system ATP-binding protein